MSSKTARTVHPITRQVERLTSIANSVAARYPTNLLTASRVSRQATYAPFMRLVDSVGQLDGSYLGEPERQRTLAGRAFVWLAQLAVIAGVSHEQVVQRGVTMDPLAFELTENVSAPDVGNTLVILGHLAQALMLKDYSQTQRLVEATLYILHQYAMGDLASCAESAWVSMQGEAHV